MCRGFNLAVLLLEWHHSLRLRTTRSRRGLPPPYLTYASRTLTSQSPPPRGRYAHRVLPFRRGHLAYRGLTPRGLPPHMTSLPRGTKRSRCDSTSCCPPPRLTSFSRGTQCSRRDPPLRGPLAIKIHRGPTSRCVAPPTAWRHSPAPAFPFTPPQRT